MANGNFIKEIAFNADQYLKEKEYWLNKLSGYLVRTGFPYDFTRPGPEPGETGGRIELESTGFMIPGELFEKLLRASNHSDLRLYMILVTALVILLAKHTGQEDILVGGPIEKQETEDNYLNSILALRLQIIPGMTFKELLFQVRQTLIEASENQNFPLEQIPYELGMETRKDDAFALFDTLVLLENIHDKSYIGHISLNMVFSFLRSAENIEGVVEYNPGIYNRETVQGITGRFVHLLWEAFLNPDTPIVNLEIIPGNEKEVLLLKMNGPRGEYPGIPIHEWFTGQAEKTPDNTAVEEMDTGRTMTYRQLHWRSNRLASRLLEKQLKPGAIAAVMGERTADIVTSLLAILKAGGVFLPLDAQNPDHRLRFILADSGADIFISQKQIVRERAGLFQAFSPGNIAVMDDEDSYPGEAGNPGIAVRPADPAYIIYTSGTTGKPKGVIVEHKSLVNYIHFATVNYVKNETVNFPLYTSIAFDLTITSIFTPLVTGNAVIVYSGWNKGNLIERIIDDKKAGIVKITPSHLYLIGEKKTAASSNTIRRLVVGGEVLKYQIARDIFDNFAGKVEIYNEYGPTEAAVGCMIYKFDPEKDKNRGHSVSIGVPAANVRVYLLDKNWGLVPSGAVGEIYIGGDGLARGYLNRPGLTGDKFIRAGNGHASAAVKKLEQAVIGRLAKLSRHERQPMTNDRLYRTGDLARRDPDGNIECLGRIDQQVKIRGFRIELGEIESQLLKHEAVQEAVVTIKEAAGQNAAGYKTDDKHICAYIVPVPGEAISDSALREYLSGQFPDYMLPAYFVFLEKIPLTPNGKVDLAVLPEPETKVAVEYVAPRNEREKKIVGIWSEILGLDAAVIGIDADFFQLGGHSLSGTVMAAKIHKTLNVKLALADLFRFSTVRELAKHLEKSLETGFTSIEPREEKEYYPLSSAQERLFIIQQLDSGIGYNVPLAYEIEGRLDIEKLLGVFRELIQRHDNLRTSFILVDDQPVQRIHKTVEFAGEYVTTGNRPEAELTAGFIRPFDLARAPLLRVKVIAAHECRHILMVDIHHIITDGISMDILMKEFSALHAGHELSPLRLYYKDFSAWQNSEKIKKEMQKQETYWLELFAGEIPVLELPTDFPRPAQQSFQGDRLQFDIDTPGITGLRELAAAQGVTLFMTVLSLYNIFLAKISGREDIIVGSPIAGRQHKDLEYILGVFINTLALRNYPQGEKSFLEFLQEVKINTLNAYENQEYQYENLVTRLPLPRDVGRNPLVDAIFAFNNVDTQFLDIPEFHVPDLKITPYKSNFLAAKVDILLNGLDNSGNVFFSLEYATRLFKKETIRRFIGYFRQVITAVLANPRQKIAEIEIVSPQEKKQVLYDFNETETTYPKNKTIHELFAGQVEKTRDNIALVGPRFPIPGAQPGVRVRAVDLWYSITYKELNKKANQLAVALRARGVKPGSIVGITSERSLELLIGLWGILKAGAAYLPVDLEYPAERILYMLHNSNIRLVLTPYSTRNDLEFTGEIVNISDENLYTGNPGNLADIKNTPENLAYILYTSGSTGKPKGVMVEHRGVVNYLKWAEGIYVGNEKCDFPLYSALSFDLTVTSLYLPLISGNKLFIYRDDENEPLISKIIRENKVQVIKLTPTHLKIVKDLNINISNIKRFIVGGEELTTKLAQDIYKKFSKAIEIYNEYGPTETVVGCMIYKYDFEKDQGNSVPIGTPVDNTRIYILDGYQNPLPRKIIGEIWISGDGVARGYLNNPRLTREKFGENRFLAGRRIYKSGDLARLMTDGNVEFLGRIDQQVKIRGFRIELSEIESELLACAEIKEAVVIAGENQEGGQCLSAYFVAHQEISLPRLKEYLSRKLPNHMIPSYFTRVEKIPLTANGKIDEKALQALDINLDTGVEYAAPGNESEELIAAAWKEVLQNDNVGVNDNFFDVGGHSLNIIRVNNKLKRVFQKDIPLVVMFRYPTVRSLARYMDDQNTGEFISDEKIDRSLNIMEETTRFFLEDAPG